MGGGPQSKGWKLHVGGQLQEEPEDKAASGRLASGFNTSQCSTTQAINSVFVALLKTNSISRQN